MLGSVIALALYDAAGCEGNLMKGMWGCVVGGRDVTAFVGWPQLLGLLAFPFFLFAAAAMAIIGVVVAMTLFRNQR